MPMASEKEKVLSQRRECMAQNISISYSREPLMIVEGAGAFLMDEQGRRYLDCVNNVAHVGHCHPRVVEATAKQLGLLNTNTRFLHPARVRYVKKLLDTFPDMFEVVYLVCSGSEANDLALRLARAYTGGHDVIVQGGAYHGHTSALIECSPYKYEGLGGFDKKEHVHKVPAPDTYRGPVRAATANAGEAYAKYVREAIEELQGSGRKLAAFMAESVMGCAGQIVPPEGYLKAAFAHAREAGGVCIADEVQVGFGRAGTHFWGFEMHGVVPDIVTLGKPIGNGYPMAAVVTTRAVADAFNNGMEYFNTGGGTTAACVAGEAVLAAIAEDALQENARVVGAHLMAGLRLLQESHALIGDVRGVGLFVGVELVEDRDSRMPVSGDKAAAVAFRCRQNGVLISTDGPFHNVLKMKPPMCFSTSDADLLLSALREALDYVTHSSPSNRSGDTC